MYFCVYTNSINFKTLGLLEQYLWIYVFLKLTYSGLATVMSDQGFWYFVMNPCEATTLSHLGTRWKYIKQNNAFIITNIDTSNPNVPGNDQNWIKVVVMAIITHTYSG